MRSIQENRRIRELVRSPLMIDRITAAVSTTDYKDLCILADTADLEVLDAVMNNPYCDTTARKLAYGTLRMMYDMIHSKLIDICVEKNVPRLESDEDE